MTNAGTTYVWFAVNTYDESQIFTSEQPLTSIEATISVPAYFKLKADTKTVSIKKTSSASASESACIQGNPLYTLKGAKYEIYVGTYPNGTYSETLTTDEYGNATGTVKYNIGTKLWAKEIVAPSGYLMPAEADNHYPLTVSSGDNEFKVYDTPTFDPNTLRLKKTGTSTDYIQGAIFKATFYARDWMDSTQLKRTSGGGRAGQQSWVRYADVKCSLPSPAYENLQLQQQGRSPERPFSFKLC